MRYEHRGEWEGLTDPSIRFEDYNPVELSAQATKLLKQSREKGRGAVDGWLTPYQLYDRRSREVSGHIRLADGMPEWLETFEMIFISPSASPTEVAPARKRSIDRRDLGYSGDYRNPYRRFCQYAGCERASEKGRLGFCQMHYMRAWANGDLGPVDTLRMPKPPTCTVDGCDDDFIKAKGMCNRHYVRWQRHGDPLYEPPVKVCRIDDCGDTVRARGLCGKHWTRWHRYGDPLVVRTMSRNGVCSVDGCQSAIEARGMCKPHYNRQRRRGVTA